MIYGSILVIPQSSEFQLLENFFGASQPSDQGPSVQNLKKIER